MKKTTLFFALLLSCFFTVANAAVINADDLDFGTVSIKGQDAIMDSAYVHVTWQGLVDGDYLWAEVVEGEADPNGFFIQSSMPYYIGYLLYQPNYPANPIFRQDCSTFYIRR